MVCELSHNQINDDLSGRLSARYAFPTPNADLFLSKIPEPDVKQNLSSVPPRFRNPREVFAELQDCDMVGDPLTEK